MVREMCLWFGNKTVKCHFVRFTSESFKWKVMRKVSGRLGTGDGGSVRAPREDERGRPKRGDGCKGDHGPHSSLRNLGLAGCGSPRGCKRALTHTLPGRLSRSRNSFPEYVP